MNFLFDAADVNLDDFKTKLGELLGEANKKQGKPLADYAKMIFNAIEQKCPGSMEKLEPSENSGIIKPKSKEGIQCLLGGSDV